ncbi:MAG: cell division protein FtsK, partial [Streptomycetaceae bacterium]|nr:cell division protein FtsK [Streptomycetaceae bacterium]
MTDTVAPTKTEAPDTDAPPSPEQPEQPEEPRAPVLVDNPNLPAPDVTDEKRKPILPPWLKDRTEFATTAKHTGSRIGYATLYHGIRWPWYATQLTMMAPRGACRFAASTNRWLWDREAAP